MPEVNNSTPVNQDDEFLANALRQVDNLVETLQKFSQISPEQLRQASTRMATLFKNLPPKEGQQFLKDVMTQVAAYQENLSRHDQQLSDLAKPAQEEPVPPSVRVGA
jgi:hypothetical protein